MLYYNQKEGATSKSKGEKIMKYRVYNEKNICKRTGIIFATYFRTKKDAKAFAETLGGEVKIERKVCTNWVAC